MKVDSYYPQIQESPVLSPIQESSLRSPIQENPFVAEYANAIGMPKNATHAKRILTAFFRTIRERIPFYASNALFSYLPKDIKPLYSYGWKNNFSTQFDYAEFIDALYEARGSAHIRLFCSKTKVEEAVAAFFEVLKKRLTHCHYETMMSFMPLVLKINLMRDYVFEGHSYIV